MPPIDSPLVIILFLSAVIAATFIGYVKGYKDGKKVGQIFRDSEHASAQLAQTMNKLHTTRENLNGPVRNPSSSHGAADAGLERSRK